MFFLSLADVLVIQIAGANSVLFIMKWRLCMSQLTLEKGRTLQITWSPDTLAYKFT